MKDKSIRKRLIKNVVFGIILLILFIVLLIINKGIEIGLYGKFETVFKHENDSKFVYILAIIIIGLLVLFAFNLLLSFFVACANSEKGRGELFFSSILDVLNVVPFIVNLLLIVDSFFISTIKVSGPSMEKTIKNGTTVLVYHEKLEKIMDGDIVIVYYPDGEDTKLVIKRLWAKEGDKVRFYKDGSDAVLEVNGVSTHMGFARDSYKYINDEYTLKQGEIYIVGDHFTNSLDSRERGILSTSGEEGLVRAKVCGKVIFSLNPIGKIGKDFSYD